MENQEPDYRGASKELERLIKEEYEGNNKVYFMLSEEGNQRIEIRDEDTGEAWHSLQDIMPPKNKDDFDEISANLIMAIFQLQDQSTRLN